MKHDMLKDYNKLASLGALPYKETEKPEPSIKYRHRYIHNSVAKVIQMLFNRYNIFDE